MKRTIIITLCMLSMGFSMVFAQNSTSLGRFEWAKGFSIPNEYDGVRGMVTDSEGNLYILASFDMYSRWEGENILPMTPYGYYPNSSNTLIAKISPDGEMVWKKVIHSNNNGSTENFDIRKIGDTAFACLLNFFVPSYLDNYTYYLDTLLLADWSDYPIQGRYMGSQVWTALITFNFDGDVLEQHFLQTSYVDSNGNDIVEYYPPDTLPWYQTLPLRSATFDMDNEGNIYICRMAYDYYIDNNIIQDSTISKIKIWVDRRIVGTCDVERNRFGTPHLLRFSPHFDTLLSSRYVIQKDDRDYLPSAHIMVDSESNVFLTGSLSLGRVGSYDSFIIDSIRHFAIPSSPISSDIGFFVKFDSSFTPQYCKYLKDTVFENRTLNTSRICFYSSTLDTDSNRAFVCGFVQKDHNVPASYTIDNRLLNLYKNDAFILSFDMETGEYKSSCIIPSVYTSNIGLPTCQKITAANNRVIIQHQYYSGIILPDTTVNTPNLQNPGLGLIIFDYQGNLIGGIDYNAFHTRNRCGNVCLQDSILYISNSLKSDATYGGTTYYHGETTSTVAKYIDPAFITPYVCPDDTGDVRIVIADEGDSFVAYPNPFHQRVNIRHSGTDPLTAAFVTDLAGHRTPVQLTPAGPGHYTLDLSAFGESTLVLTLVTASGRPHSFTLLHDLDLFQR